MTPAAVFSDALHAASLLAIDPAGLGGMAIRAQAGPVRDRLLATLPASRRLPPGIADDALLGGLDLAGTLQAGRTLRTRGLLEEARGRFLVAPMAERMTTSLAARLTAAMDGGGGFSLVLLDEGGQDERASAALLDRLAFHLDLSAIGYRDAAAAAGAVPIDAAPIALSTIGVDEGVIEALCHAARALGVASPRAPLLALRAARASASLAGRSSATLEDAALAARLVLAPRATVPPQEASPERQPEPPDQPPREGQDRTDDASSLSDATEIVLEAARAALPANLLAGLVMVGGRGPQKSQGAAGIRRRGTGRGRPVGVRPGLPGAGARINLIETLRAAAPWQRLRAKPQSGGPALRRDDFRIVRTETPDRSTTIFLVDASGSSAINRLAEAKGAVELLLADCYRRRDEVAVISFRGQGAQLLLPPTRSLVRARRSLAGLPGGGGTPLAAGLDAGMALAELVRRGGATPTLVLLTDGRANVTRAGGPGRAMARDEALAASRRVRAAGFASLLLDTSPRPAPDAASLAAAMGARYMPMPYPSAAGVSRAIRGPV